MALNAGPLCPAAVLSPDPTPRRNMPRRSGAFGPISATRFPEPGTVLSTLPSHSVQPAGTRPASPANGTMVPVGTPFSALFAYGAYWNGALETTMLLPL